MASRRNMALLLISSLTATPIDAFSILRPHSSFPIAKRYIEYCYSDQDCADKQADIDRRNIIIGCVVGAIFLLLLLSSVCFCVRRRRRIQASHANPGWVASNYAAPGYPMQQPGGMAGQYNQGYDARAPPPVPAGGQGAYPIAQQDGQAWLQHPTPGYVPPKYN